MNITSVGINSLGNNGKVYICQNSQNEKDEIEELIKKLKDKDEPFYSRASAAKALGELGDKSAVPALIDTLKEYEPYIYDVRVSAAEALGRIGDARAVPALIGVLKDENENVDVKIAAAKALGEMGDLRGVVLLTEALKHENSFYRYREKVADALGEIKDIRAIPVLIGVLKDENEDVDVKIAAAKALGEIGDKRAVSALMDVLKNPKFNENQLVVVAVEALGKIKDVRVIPVLVETLRKTDEYGWYDVSNAVVEALVKIGKLAVPELIEALKDENIDIRECAAKALGKIKDNRAVFPLIEALKAAKYDHWQDYRHSIATGKSMGDKGWRLRATAVEALGSIGDARAAESLLNALNDGNQSVRMTAGEALYPMLNSFSGERRLNILLGLIKCNIPQIQLKSIAELKEIGLNSDNNIKNQILEVFNDRLGIGLLNPQEEKDPLVLEALRKAYNKIKESMKGGK